MKRLYAWWWLSYPVIVAFLVAFSFNVLFNEGELTRLSTDSNEVAAQAAKVAVISQKVAALETVNVSILNEQMEKLVLAVPVTKPVWQMVSNINYAASSSGSVVDGYKSSVGSLKVATTSAVLESGLMMDVEYSVADFPTLIKLLGGFESRLPLIVVNKLDMSAGKAMVSISSLWKPGTVVSQMGDTPLPEGFSERIKTAVDKLSQFEFTEGNVGTGSGVRNEGVVNPF